MSPEHVGASPVELNDQDEPSAKRLRGFIARQACDNCRHKKTRCDEDLPCGLCKSLQLSCHYSGRKPTSKEVSLGSLSRTLQRIEGKINNLVAQPISYASNGPSSALLGVDQAPSPIQRTPASDTTNVGELRAHPIPFSAHLMLAWPGVQQLLPESVKALCETGGFDYAAVLESSRPPLPTPSLENTQPGWLSHLSISTLKTLSRLFFSTFNTATPLLDEEVYFQRTLPTAISGDFPANIESCIALTVMALGSWMETTTVERGPVDSSGNLRFGQGTSPRNSSGGTDLPGLMYFNEARRRFGFLDGGVGIESCQFYLLAALYHAQAFRPMDWWMMTNRAATCCKMFWKCKSDDADEWVVDMQSRLYWITVMFEVMLADEFAFTDSNLFNHEDQAPLPKFVTQKQKPDNHLSQNVEDGSCFHYHFLSQIAHRILLTRVRDSLFISYKGTSYPLPALEEELTSQLEAWRQQLPQGLWFDTDAVLSNAQSQSHGSAAAWLRARYIIAKYHIGRPLIHRAIHDPISLTDADVQACAAIASHIIQWTSVMEVIESMQTSLPYRFLLCSQLFGQQVIIYSLHVSPDKRLQSLMSSKHHEWFQLSLTIVAKYAYLSETVQKDWEIASALYAQISSVSA